MSTDTIRERATALCNYIEGNGGFGFQAHALANELMVALSAPDPLIQDGTAAEAALLQLLGRFDSNEHTANVEHCLQVAMSLAAGDKRAAGANLRLLLREAFPAESLPTSSAALDPEATTILRDLASFYPCFVRPHNLQAVARLVLLGMVVAEQTMEGVELSLTEAGRSAVANLTPEGPTQ